MGKSQTGGLEAIAELFGGSLRALYGAERYARRRRSVGLADQHRRSATPGGGGQRPLARTRSRWWVYRDDGGGRERRCGALSI